jgi:hypothetical protein
MERPLPLVYIGNQYDRDEVFDRFFVPAAAHFPHRVAGKWPYTNSWPNINFTGRCPYPDVAPLYRSALTTILLLPHRYTAAAQMTQRLIEAVLAGCLPITPSNIECAAMFTPQVLHVADGRQVIDRIRSSQIIAGTASHTQLLYECLDRLSLFSLSRQITTLEHTLERLIESA